MKKYLFRKMFLPSHIARDCICSVEGFCLIHAPSLLFHLPHSYFSSVRFPCVPLIKPCQSFVSSDQGTADKSALTVHSQQDHSFLRCKRPDVHNNRSANTQYLKATLHSVLQPNMCGYAAEKKRAYACKGKGRLLL